MSKANLKVLHVSFSDIEGGAARAAYRIHESLLTLGINSQMLVARKLTDDFNVLGPLGKIQRGMAIVKPTLDSIPTRKYKNKTQTAFSPAWLSSTKIISQINSISPDIVNLHWVNGGMIKIEDLAEIKAPIVWTMHDMWPYTGGCHYDENCGKYIDGCGKCPVLGSSKNNDLSKKIISRKIKALKKVNSLSVVGPSKWMANSAKNSLLFADVPNFNIPYPIDPELFSPFPMQEARQLLNLPIDKKLVLFGAVSATSDPRKGFKELMESLGYIENQSQVELVVFGSGQPKSPIPTKFKVHYLGKIHDHVTKRLIYNSADVMVAPSLQENLANTIIEPLMCGTPVVGFNIGGNPDMIIDMKNGALADEVNPASLSIAISKVLNHVSPESLRTNAREYALKLHNPTTVAAQYLALYNNILDSKQITGQIIRHDDITKTNQVQHSSGATRL